MRNRLGDSELIDNIVFLNSDFKLPNKPRCKYISDYDFYLILLLAKVNNLDLITRLLYPVKISDDDWQCWFRSDDWSHYSTIDKQKAHRVSYEIFREPIIKTEVCHYCDRKGCINPWHLFQGSHSENMKDAMLKGRVHKLQINSKIRSS